MLSSVIEVRSFSFASKVDKINSAITIEDVLKPGALIVLSPVR